MYFIKTSMLLTTVLFLMSSVGNASIYPACNGAQTRYDNTPFGEGADKVAAKEAARKSLDDCERNQREKETKTGDRCIEARNKAIDKYNEARKNCHSTGMSESQCWNTAKKCASANTDDRRTDQELQNAFSSIIGQVAPQFSSPLSGQQYSNECSGWSASDWDKQESSIRGRIKDNKSSLKSLMNDINQATESKTEKQASVMEEMNRVVKEMDAARLRAQKEGRDEQLRFARETVDAADKIRNAELMLFDFEMKFATLTLQRNGLANELLSDMLECKTKYNPKKVIQNSFNKAANSKNPADDALTVCYNRARQKRQFTLRSIDNQERKFKSEQAAMVQRIAEGKEMLRMQKVAVEQDLMDKEKQRTQQEMAFSREQQNLIAKFNAAENNANQKLQNLNVQLMDARSDLFKDTNSMNFLGDRPRGSKLPSDALDSMQAAYNIQKSAKELGLMDADGKSDCFGANFDISKKFKPLGSFESETDAEKVLNGEATDR